MGPKPPWCHPGFYFQPKKLGDAQRRPQGRPEMIRVSPRGSSRVKMLRLIMESEPSPPRSTLGPFLKVSWHRPSQPDSGAPGSPGEALPVESGSLGVGEPCVCLSPSQTELPGGESRPRSAWCCRGPKPRTARAHRPRWTPSRPPRKCTSHSNPKSYF